jgi:hypothetical protein
MAHNPPLPFADGGRNVRCAVNTGTIRAIHTAIGEVVIIANTWLGCGPPPRTFRFDNSTRLGSGLNMACSYLPITRIVNDPGTTAPWAPRPPPGGGGGAGPRSWLIVRMWFVLLSKVIVRAPFIVSRFCSTSKLVGLFSFTTVNVPLPCVLNASIVEGLNTAPSDPPASGTLVRILPSVALRMVVLQLSIGV